MREPRTGWGTAARSLLVSLAVTSAFMLPGPVAAQYNGNAANPEDLDFQRPEAWAMTYFTSVSLLTGLGVPGAVREGNLVASFEGALVPELSDGQRRVGFNGTKLEDLNKTSVFGRVRFTFGLTDDAEFTVAYVLPVTRNGATPNLVSASVGIPLKRTASWRVGTRVYGQLGTIKGDFTCDVATVAAGNDPDLNPFGCDEVSADRVKQRYLGADIGAAALIGSVEPYVTVGVNRMSGEFNVYALTNGSRDDSAFSSSGFTLHGTAGVLFDINERWYVSSEVFYSPLSADRPVEVSGSDSLLNGRMMLSFRF